MIKENWINNRGMPVTSLWIPSETYTDMSPIAQVYGVCFDKNSKVLVIRNPLDDGTFLPWNLPGGTPEKGETPEETLVREVDEEADVDISKFKMIGAAEVFFKDNPNVDHYFQLRYVALIDRIKEQTLDPHDNKMVERKFIDPNEFTEYIKWGKISQAIIETALKEKENL